MDHVWSVTYMDADDKTVEQVTADAWQTNANGDLAFVNGPNGREPFLVRGYAKGVWLTVSLYS